MPSWQFSHPCVFSYDFFLNQNQPYSSLKGNNMAFWTLQAVSNPQTILSLRISSISDHPVLLITALRDWWKFISKNQDMNPFDMDFWKMSNYGVSWGLCNILLLIYAVKMLNEYLINSCNISVACFVINHINEWKAIGSYPDFVGLYIYLIS